MEHKFNGLWVALACLILVLTAGCGNKGSGLPQSKKATTFIDNSLVGIAPPPVNNTPINGGGNQSGPAPLQFEVEGTGNHPLHLCVPALTKLQLRVKPHSNTQPLRDAATTPVYNGRYVYDGTPAYYTKLRLRLSIQGTTAAWDYLANTETNSVVGDYSAYFTPIEENSLPDQAPLPVPEYGTVWIFGSDPNDGLCTYWEKRFGKCPSVSNDLRYGEIAGCPEGEQKILITNVVSDYPCGDDFFGWCAGGQLQFVPDQQHWSATIEAATDATRNF